VTGERLYWRPAIRDRMRRNEFGRERDPGIYVIGGATTAIRYLYPSPEGEPVIAFEIEDRGPIAFVPVRQLREWLDREEPAR